MEVIRIHFCAWELGGTIFAGHSLSRRTGLWRLTPESSSLRAFQRLSVRRRMRAAKGTLIPSPAECVSRWRVEVPEKTARSRNESNQSVPDWEGDGWSWWDRIIAAQVSPKEGRTRAPVSAARHLPWYSTNSSGNCCFNALVLGTSHTWMYGFPGLWSA